MLPTNLVKKNYLDAMQKMLKTPGWEILTEDELIALKSPAKLNFINVVWGEASSNNIQKVKSFFKGHSFNWILAEHYDSTNLMTNRFAKPQASPEMILNINDYQLKKLPANIEVSQVTNQDDFNIWAEIISETFKIKSIDVKSFFRPLIDIAGEVPYLTYYNGIPVGTSLVFCSSKIAGLYVISTLQKYRKKGIGFAATQACIEHAKSNNVNYATLYASSIGKHLYAKMGFQTSQVLQEYFYNTITNSMQHK